MEHIRIIIVEDDIGWLKSMSSYLNSYDDIIVAGTATNRDKALELAKSVKPDVVLMDINLNGNREDGIHITDEILQFFKTKVIIMTSISDEDIIKDAFLAGAVNYITKDNYAEIPHAIRTTFNNSSPVEVLLKEFKRLKKEEQLKDLTKSEREIYYLLEKGFSRFQIEQELLKSKNTIKTQIKKILVKLQVSNTKKAVKKLNRDFNKFT